MFLFRFATVHNNGRVALEWRGFVELFSDFGGALLPVFRYNSIRVGVIVVVVVGRQASSIQ